MKKFLFTFIILSWLAAAGTLVPAQSNIAQYLNIRSATSPSFSPDGKSLAYLTNVSGTLQVWRIDLPSGQPRQLTDYEDAVSFVRWLGDGSGMIFGKAKGGDENTQFYWMRTDGTGVRALTNEPKVRHNFGVVSDDGKTIAYSSNKRDRNYFDVYTMDIASGEETLRYRQNGSNSVAAMNEAGSKLVISRESEDLSVDNSLYLVNVRDGSELPLTPHSGAATYSSVHFVADGLVMSSDEGREFSALVQLREKNAARDDLSPGNRELVVLDAPKWDVTSVRMNPYGGVMAYVVNRDGYSELYLRKYETGGKPLITTFSKRSEAVRLPAEGVVGGTSLSRDDSKLAFAFSSAGTGPSDIWLYDIKTRSMTQLTHSDLAGLSRSSFIAPRLVRFRTFDGRQISGWNYRPAAAGRAKLPVIVSVHGGPEGQERPGFSGLYQYFLSRGYAIFAPNVRGSTGYGKTFTHLDDVRKREDSVKDLAAGVDWLKKAGGADPRRIAVMGGSYGGYMTLAAITLYPDLFAAAVDTVGIANWESFLKNTSGYRRKQREVEYGRLDRDLDFLRSISPLGRVDRIRTPLFVIQGRNDPRVPNTEAEQIVTALRKRSQPVEYKLYDDEGHGIVKLKNRLELYPLVADFLDRYLKKQQ